jgi:hypothetical protein
MGDYIFHGGKVLGRFKFHGAALDLVFIAESHDDLFRLMGLESDEEIHYQSGGVKLFGDFREETLRNVSVFFPTPHDYLHRDDIC